MKKRIIMCGILAATFIVSLLLMNRETRAFSGCEEDCQKCHSLSRDEVNLILKKMKMPDAKLLDVRISPVKGLWEASVESKGRRGILYVDFSKKYVVRGSIVEVDAAIDKTRQRLDEINKDKKIDPAGIPLKEAPVLGSNSAEKKVIVFTDPD